MDRPSGVPLHVALDYEGDFSHDFPFDGINMFPSNMGIRAAGGPRTAYRVGLAVARQLAAIGVNMMHSPVCDVNINPANPEINIRSFSDDPQRRRPLLRAAHEGPGGGAASSPRPSTSPAAATPPWTPTTSCPSSRPPARAWTPWSWRRTAP